MAAASLNETQAQQVLRQVEFYFSDSNLPRDNFLRKSVQESEDGLVSLALICSFARMRKHLNLGEVKADDVPEETVLAVAETLRKSAFLKVSEDGKKIGRNTELAKPEEVLEQVDSRTVAVSPCPYDVKLEDVQSFFGLYGKVNSVRLPRVIGDKRQFCGTALVEFSEEEVAEKILSESIVYAGAELETKPKKDFDSDRQQKWKDFEKARLSKESSNGSYPKGLVVAFKLKSIQPEASMEKNGTDGNADEGNGEKNSGNPNDTEEKSEDIEKGNGGEVEETNEKTAADATDKNEDSQEKNARGKDVITREDLKKIFQKFGTVRYIDFSAGDESGYVRFEDPDAAVQARAAAVLTDEGGLVVKNHIATLEPLTGDAEQEYWSLLRENQEKYKENRGNYSRGRGRNNRGGRHFDGKRKQRGNAGNGRSNKVQKLGGDGRSNKVQKLGGDA